MTSKTPKKRFRTAAPPKHAVKRLAMGVDRGASRTRIVLMNGLGEELKRAVHHTSHIKQLPDLIVKTALKWGLASHIPAVIATRGAMTRKWKKPFLLKKLRDKINLLDVISDAQAAYIAAHGSQKGVLLIAGTGSVAFLKGRNGGFEKVGGHSPPGGDPGSGLWIGTRFLKKSGSVKKGLDRRLRAAYASKAVLKAEKGDPQAIALISEAHDHLSALLDRSVKEHRAAGPLRVALTGGLMQNVFFRKKFIVRARRRFARARLVFITLKRPAEHAAATLAMESFYARNKGS